MSVGGTPSLPSAAERSDAGRALRTAVPRAHQSTWTAAEHRPDPIAALRATEADRLPELLGLRYGRMAASPFGFLRGSAGIMAADLANTPHSGLRVQACGDAHIGNFRLLGTPERALNFDLNDFDETLPAPFEWDLKRLAASAIVAGRHNGFSARECRRVATKAARSYRRHTEEYASRSALDIWYSRIDSETLESVLQRENLGRKQNRMLRKRMSRARDKSHEQALRRLTTVVDGHTRLREDPPLIYHEPRDEEMVERVVRSYRDSLRNHLQVLFDRYELVDYAIRVGGVGSVGTRCWVALFESHDGNADNSIILQMKQAGRSVLEPYAGACRYANQGQRVVEGKRLLQAAGDILLGWTGAGVEGIDYYVRQLWDMKGRFDTEEMDADGMALFAELCGWTLARAHARSGDPVATLGYIGSGNSFDRAITEFAVAYADQTERDHERLCRAIERGELPGDGLTRDG
jgi:uncharacterized protein (DUF2252 family)